MAWKISDFCKENEFVFLVHCLDVKKIKKNDQCAFILHEKWNEDCLCLSFLIEQTHVSKEKILKAFRLFKLKSSLLDVSICSLTFSESMKMQFMISILQGYSIFIFQHFFEDLIDSERNYFKRLFRNLMAKQNFSFLFLEDDLNFVCETVKGFYLCYDNHYEWITDFYDDKIYQYVEMPHSVELIKYLESCSHAIDHEITFAETLKAIYRGVS